MASKSKQSKWKNHVENEAMCFCKHLVSSYKTRKGDKWLKCGVSVDYPKLQELLKKCKDKKEKAAVYKNFPMGCKFNMSVKDYKNLKHAIYALDPKDHPKCEEHNLIMQLKISGSENNNGRNYFTCSAKAPDAPCHAFEWFDSLHELSYKEPVDLSHIQSVEDLSPLYNPFLKKAVEAAKVAVVEFKRQEDELPDLSDEEGEPSPPKKKKKKKSHLKLNLSSMVRKRRLDYDQGEKEEKQEESEEEEVEKDDATLTGDLYDEEKRDLVIHKLRENPDWKIEDESRYVDLEKQIMEIESKKEWNQKPDVLQEHDRLKGELNKYSDYVTEGAIIRSKSRWYEDGEKSTKYFLNSEKRNKAKTCVRKVFDNDTEITDSSKILENITKYFGNLYHLGSDLSEHECYQFLTENVNVPKLITEESGSCDGFLISEECLTALNAQLKDTRKRWVNQRVLLYVLGYSW
ncbi:hypothetical protein AC249_AIPGENE9428 [Exaiptasia diaphana]|nr:hypothetical protein AC249_AIPGENE9428 [Exaiptasia diaphana]